MTGLYGAGVSMTLRSLFLNKTRLYEEISENSRTA